MKKQYNVQTSYAAAIPRGSRNGAGEGLRRTVVTSSGGGNVDLSSKLDASVFYDLFEKINIGSAESPLYAIRAKYGLYSDSFVSAMGLNPNTGGGGGGATALSELNDVQLSGLLTGDVLIYDGTHWANRPQSSIVPDLSEYATRTWVQQQGYATTAALTAHAGDTALHVSASERTLWNRTATDFAAIVGADSDQIINKWEEVVAFLDTYTEADTLANLLSNKVDKTTRVVAGTGLTGGGALTGNVTLSLASRTLWGQSFNGEGNVSGDMTGVGSIDATGNITITRSPARFIAINGDATISLNNSTYKGIYYDTIAKWLIASDGTNTFLEIGNVAIGKKTAQYPLDVAGAIRLQNRLYFGDSTHYIELDENGDFHFSHGVYSDSFLSALGLNPSTGGGGGGSYDRLDLWSDYTAERAGWVLSAGLGYDLYNRVRSLEGGSALSFTTEGTGNVVTAVKKSGTAVVVTKGLTALTSHQPIYALNFQAGAFEAKKYTPNTGVQTVNVPTKTSHLSNDSGFITAAALTGYATQSWVQGLGYITSATANATFATKLGIDGNQIGTYVGGKLGNLITVPYAANADKVDNLHSSDFFRQYAIEGGLGKTFDFNSYTNGGYVYITKDINDATFSNAPFDNSGGGFGLFVMPYSSYLTQLVTQYASSALFMRNRFWSTGGMKWSEWRQFAYTDMNVASATKLQTARTLWGQSFNGTGNVSGNMTGVGSISASGEYITSSANGFRIAYGKYGTIFREDDSEFWILLTDSGNSTGTFNSLRPFHINLSTGKTYIGGSGLTATVDGYIGINNPSPSYKLDVAGQARFSKGLVVPYQWGSWLNMATREDVIQGENKNSADSAHTLFRVEDSNGNPIAFGGLGAHVGFYGFLATEVSQGVNSPKWSTRWEVKTGELIHGGDFTVNGVIHSSSGIFSDGYMSAKGINTASDVRLKRRIADVALTVRDVAEAPVYRFAWINGGGIDVGSTAQYWAARVPELTHLLADGIHLGLDYGKAALLSVVAVARATADHERRIAALERQLQNRTI